jgi:hypothetical protein
LFERDDVCEMPFQIAQIYEREEMIHLLLSSAVRCDERAVRSSKYAFLQTVGATAFVYPTQIHIKPTKLQLKHRKKQAKVEIVASNMETRAARKLSASFLKSESKLLARAEQKPKRK